MHQIIAGEGAIVGQEGVDQISPAAPFCWDGGWSLKSFVAQAEVKVN